MSGDLVRAIILSLKVIERTNAQGNEAKTQMLVAAKMLDSERPDELIESIKPFLNNVKLDRYSEDGGLTPQEIWDRIKCGEVVKVSEKIDELWGDDRLVANETAKKVADEMVLLAKRKKPAVR